jgi:3-isopropylmalate dehydrogenase
MSLYTTDRGNHGLRDALPGWASGTLLPGRTAVIGVLPGEGIGPEVVGVALDVLDAVSGVTGRKFDIRFGGLIGNDALRVFGKGLSDQVVAFCDDIFADGGALFCGAGGGRFVYELRQQYDLFCKFTPLRPEPALRDCGAIRPEGLGNVDIVAVRENVGGLYFGEWGERADAAGERAVYHHFSYRQDHVDRILQVAHRLAARRRGRLCVTVKRDGAPAISDLWMQRVEHITEGSPVAVEVLDIDNAAYQLIADPRRFDVLVSPNLFGDILADCGALLLGSRGMSYSGNFDGAGRAVYQTGHGAAYDLAGTGTANPVGQLMALAMLLEESFMWPEGAALVRDAVTGVLASGIRTADIAGPGSEVVGTREFGVRVRRALEAR